MYASAEQLTIHSLENYDEPTRHHNDTITWLAETLHGSMRTSFDYRFDGQELYAEDGGAMGEVFETSITTAKQIVELNPNLLFELRRRVIEHGEYQDMLKMAKGELPNTMVTISDFPEELMSSKEDIGGYNANRKQTMLRIIYVLENGDIRMVTQSLDGSNRQALEAVYEKAKGDTAEAGELLGQRIHLDLPEVWQGQLVDNLRQTYDQSLHEQYHGIWHAGIRQSSEHQPINTAEFVAAQADLIKLFVEAKLQNSKAAEKRRYGLAATVKERFNNYFKPEKIVMSTTVVYQPISESNIDLEIERATQNAIKRGDTYSGCGMKVEAEASIQDQLEALGFGNKTVAEEDQYGPLQFTCKKGHNNTRKRGELIDYCQHCGDSVSCQAPEKTKQRLDIAKYLKDSMKKLIAA